MKKTLLLIALAFGMLTSKAQWLPDSNDMPTIGTMGTYQFSDTTGVVIDTPGTGKAWDFSLLQDSAGTFTHTYEDPSNTQYSSTFTNSTVALVIDIGGGKDYRFYDASNASEWVLNGVEDNTTFNNPAKYSDPGIIHQFPLSFQNTIVDSIESQFTASGFNAFRKGTIATTVDASGTLKNQDSVQFNDVIRIETIIDIRDSSFAFGQNIINTFHIERYEWYDTSQTVPVLIYESEDSDISGNQSSSVEFAYSLENDSVPTSSVKRNSAGQNLELYPNPATNLVKVRLRSEKAAVYRISVLDMQGREVLEAKPFLFYEGYNTVSLNTGGLPAGVYSLNIETSGISMSRKLLISK